MLYDGRGEQLVVNNWLEMNLWGLYSNHTLSTFEHFPLYARLGEMAKNVVLNYIH